MRPVLALVLASLVPACSGGDDGAVPVDGGAADGDGGGEPGADAGGFDDAASYLFDASIVRTYALALAPEDWTYLKADPAREEYVPATLRLGDEEVTTASLRFKGSYGSLRFCVSGGGIGDQPCEKLPLKIAFDQLDPAGRFHGVKKLNLHAMDADPTKMHEALSYALFREAGVPAPRTAYARVIVNGELLGLFAVVEEVDGRFTRARAATFGDDGEGNIYKETWPDAFEEQPYLDALESNRDESPSAATMVRFAQALAAGDEGGDAGFRAALDAWMAPGQLARYMAVARLVDSWDDIVGWYCAGGCFNHNYYWYESTTADRVWLVAWDTDHTFEEPSPIREGYGMPDWDDLEAHCNVRFVFRGIPARAPACDPILRRMATALWDAYAAESQTLLDGAFSEVTLGERIDGLEALIADAVAEDPDTADTADWQAAVTRLRDVVVPAKRQHVLDKLQ